MRRQLLVILIIMGLFYSSEIYGNNDSVFARLPGFLLNNINLDVEISNEANNAHYIDCAQRSLADLDGDGMVAVTDLALMMNDWSKKSNPASFSAPQELGAYSLGSDDIVS